METACFSETSAYESVQHQNQEQQQQQQQQYKMKCFETFRLLALHVPPCLVPVLLQIKEAAFAVQQFGISSAHVQARTVIVRAHTCPGCA
jgi:hypothetical protein